MQTTLMGPDTATFSPGESPAAGLNLGFFYIVLDGLSPLLFTGSFYTPLLDQSASQYSRSSIPRVPEQLNLSAPSEV